MLALKTLGLADAFGASRIPILALNVVYPLVPGKIVEFCAGKKAVIALEEPQPRAVLACQLLSKSSVSSRQNAVVGKRGT